MSIKASDMLQCVRTISRRYKGNTMITQTGDQAETQYRDPATDFEKNAIQLLRHVISQIPHP